jgi:hypothetical protein
MNYGLANTAAQFFSPRLPTIFICQTPIMISFGMLKYTIRYSSIVAPLRFLPSQRSLRTRSSNPFISRFTNNSAKKRLVPTWFPLSNIDCSFDCPSYIDNGSARHRKVLLSTYGALAYHDSDLPLSKPRIDHGPQAVSSCNLARSLLLIIGELIGNVERSMLA